MGKSSADHCTELLICPLISHQPHLSGLTLMDVEVWLTVRVPVHPKYVGLSHCSVEAGLVVSHQTLAVSMGDWPVGTGSSSFQTGMV